MMPRVSRMKAMIRNISCDDFDFEASKPEDETNFFVTLRIRIGTEGGLGADDFFLHVCTVEWLAQNMWTSQWGRHLLIVRRYNSEAISADISSYVEQCSGTSWDAIAAKLARMFAWEFEDYQP